MLVQGMSLVPAVTELMLAELLYLQYDSPTKPVFMYINSTGVTVNSLFLLVGASLFRTCSAPSFSYW